MNMTDGIALYAGIVATAALGLEVRRWFETGVRLSAHLMVRGKTFGDFGAGHDENAEYVVVRVTNRGDRPTTLTGLGMYRFKSIFRRWRRRPYFAAVVNVGYPMPLPYRLEPGAQWTGMVIHTPEMVEMIKAGDLFLAIGSSHASREQLERVKWPEDRKK